MGEFAAGLVGGCGGAGVAADGEAGREVVDFGAGGVAGTPPKRSSSRFKAACFAPDTFPNEGTWKVVPHFGHVSFSPAATPITLSGDWH